MLIFSQPCNLHIDLSTVTYVHQTLHHVTRVMLQGFNRNTFMTAVSLDRIYEGRNSIGDYQTYTPVTKPS